MNKEDCLVCKNGTRDCDIHTGIEQGEASMLIKLEDGNIIVEHGTDKVILLEKNNVPAGSWDKIWETLNNL